MRQFNRKSPLRIFLLLLVCSTTASLISGQTKRTQPKPQGRHRRNSPRQHHRRPIGNRLRQLRSIDLVLVPVAATAADGRNVPGLSQAEFTVTEDGVKQQIALFAITRLPVNVVLLLDTSASTKDKLALMQAAAVAFVEKLDTGDRVESDLLRQPGARTQRLFE